MATPALARALMEIIATIVKLSENDFVNIEQIEDWRLIYFIDRQVDSCEALRTNLSEYQDKIRELICKSKFVIMFAQ